MDPVRVPLAVNRWLPIIDMMMGTVCRYPMDNIGYKVTARPCGRSEGMETMRPIGSQKSLEHRRVNAMQMLEKGIALTEVAENLDVHQRSVRRWKSIFRKNGVEGLKAKPIPGRPRVR